MLRLALIQSSHVEQIDELHNHVTSLKLSLESATREQESGSEARHHLEEELRSKAACLTALDTKKEALESALCASEEKVLKIQADLDRSESLGLESQVRGLLGTTRHELD